MTKIKLANLNGKAEIFYSIQGEGKNMGKPCIFIRTSMCNLHCIWCDTDYTWNWEGTRFKHIKDSDVNYKKYDMNTMIKELTIDEVKKAVEIYSCKHLVFTGGEPMLQKKEILELMTYLSKIDEEYFFEIETNGTIIPSSKFDALINQYNVSPKLENSNNSKQLREKPKAYKYFSCNPKAIFKYVVSHKNDLREILNLIDKYKIDNNKVYLMAEGTQSDELREKQLWLVEVCKEYCFNFTDRLHIHLYGDKKGV